MARIVKNRLIAKAQSEREISDKLSYFVNWINEKFKPEYSNHPGAFIVGDNVVISGECYVFEKLDDTNWPIMLIDYYGEHRGGYPWIHPEIEFEAKKRNLRLEWYDPGAVYVYAD